LGLEAPYCIEELMMPTLEAEWLWRKVFLPELTRRFGVSVAAAVIRCENLQLVSGTGRSLMSGYHQRLLRYPSQPDSPLETVRIVDGRPRRASQGEPTLFDGPR
jgi:hypothetical protein